MCCVQKSKLPFCADEHFSFRFSCLEDGLKTFLLPLKEALVFFHCRSFQKHSHWNCWIYQIFCNLKFSQLPDATNRPKKQAMVFSSKILFLVVEHRCTSQICSGRVNVGARLPASCGNFYTFNVRQNKAFSKLFRRKVWSLPSEQKRWKNNNQNTLEWKGSVSFTFCQILLWVTKRNGDHDQNSFFFYQNFGHCSNKRSFWSTSTTSCNLLHLEEFWLENFDKFSTEAIQVCCSLLSNTLPSDCGPASFPLAPKLCRWLSCVKVWELWNYFQSVTVCQNKCLEMTQHTRANLTSETKCATSNNNFKLPAETVSTRRHD